MPPSGWPIPHVPGEIKQPCFVSPEKYDYFLSSGIACCKEGTCQEREVSASSRAQSLHLNSDSRNSPGSATCSRCFLQLISRLLLLKIAFGKCLMAYFVTHHMLYPSTE